MYPCVPRNIQTCTGSQGNKIYIIIVVAHCTVRHVSVLWVPLFKSVKKCQTHGLNPGY